MCSGFRLAAERFVDRVAHLAEPGVDRRVAEKKQARDLGVRCADRVERDVVVRLAIGAE